MYKVSFVENNLIKHSKEFKTEEQAREWIKSKGITIKPLKLLVWDNLIDCYSTVEKFNDRGNARGCSLYKTVFINHIYSDTTQRGKGC